MQQSCDGNAEGDYEWTVRVTSRGEKRDIMQHVDVLSDTVCSLSNRLN